MLSVFSLFLRKCVKGESVFQLPAIVLLLVFPVIAFLPATNSILTISHFQVNPHKSEMSQNTDMWINLNVLQHCLKMKKAVVWTEPGCLSLTRTSYRGDLMKNVNDILRIDRKIAIWIRKTVSNKGLETRREVLPLKLQISRGLVELSADGKTFV